MDSKIVSREIRRVIRPVLKSAGFTRFTGRNSWRTTNDTVWVVNFQSFNEYLADRVNVTTFSFSINLSIRYECVSSRKLDGLTAEPFPKEYHCHARRRLLRTIEQTEPSVNDVWYVRADGENLEEVITDARDVIDSVALPWFSHTSDHNDALDWILSEAEDEYCFCEAPAAVATALALETKRQREVIPYLERWIAQVHPELHYRAEMLRFLEALKS